MCQSKQQGGRRCANRLSGMSNYPSVVKLDNKSDEIIVVSSLDDNPALALHLAAIAARTGKPLSDEAKEAAQAVSGAYSALPKKAVWEHWDYILRAPQPGAGLQAIYDMGWENNFPELAGIRGVPQDPIWHPEGSVEIHTQQAADIAARNAARDNLSDDETRVAVMGTICHDLGKANATIIDGDKISSPEHPETGAPLAKSFLERIGAPLNVQREVPLIVKNHMCHAGGATPRAVRRLMNRLDNEGEGTTVEAWARVAEADVGGRGEAGTYGVSKPWLELKEKIIAKAKAPRLIVNGDVLIQHGVEDKLAYREIISKAREAQESGEITDSISGDKWLKVNGYI